VTSYRKILPAGTKITHGDKKDTLNILPVTSYQWILPVGTEKTTEENSALNLRPESSYQRILPVGTEIASEENGKLILRCSLTSESDWNAWLIQLSSLSQTNWIVSHTRAETKNFGFSKDYKCHHSSKNKGSYSLKNCHCSAEIMVRMKRMNKYTRHRDPYVKVK